VTKISNVATKNDDAALAGLFEFIGYPDAPEYKDRVRRLLGDPYLEMLIPAQARIDAALKEMRAERGKIEAELGKSQEMLARFEAEHTDAEQEIHDVENALAHDLKAGKSPKGLRERLRPLEDKRDDARRLADALRDDVIPGLAAALSGLDGAMHKAQADIINAVVDECHQKIGELAAGVFKLWKAGSAARNVLAKQAGNTQMGVVKQVEFPVSWRSPWGLNTALSLPDWAVEGKPWQP
jgi:septal ring factor EnvC (AmiA/AmiB activator)